MGRLSVGAAQTSDCGTDIPTVRPSRIVEKKNEEEKENAPPVAGFGNRRNRMRAQIRGLELLLYESPSVRLTLSDISRTLHLERTYCSKIFPTLVGKCYSKWIRDIRMAAARRLLLERQYSITEVAHDVGYDDITTFERNFRKSYGVSPTTFRELQSTVGRVDVGMKGMLRR